MEANQLEITENKETQDVTTLIHNFFSDFPQFSDFLNESGLSLDTYLSSLKSYMIHGKRYFRTSLSKTFEKSEIVKMIQESEQGNLLTENDINQLPGDLLGDIYSLPQNTKINNLPFYKTGDILGIDFSSTLVVKSLSPKPGEKILDMCCCPGAKLLYIADIVSKKLRSPEFLDLEKESLVVGNDINGERLHICKALVKKSEFESLIKISNQDAVIFDYKEQEESIQFDKVLVDVECTHDGSFKHMVKFIKPGNDHYTKKIKKEKHVDPKKPESKISNNERKRRLNQQILHQKHKELTKKYFSDYDKKNEWTKEDFETRVLDKKKLELLGKLQQDVLFRGFEILKENGTIVYSTCSLSKSQNEDIITNLIEKVKDTGFQVEIVEPFNAEFTQFLKDNEKFKETYGIREGSIQNTIRFDPTSNSTSGMFLCKMIKLKTE